jgi:hypothetical protein
VTTPVPIMPDAPNTTTFMSKANALLDSLSDEVASRPSHVKGRPWCGDYGTVELLTNASRLLSGDHDGTLIVP